MLINHLKRLHATCTDTPNLPTCVFIKEHIILKGAFSSVTPTINASAHFYANKNTNTFLCRHKYISLSFNIHKTVSVSVFVTECLCFYILSPFLFTITSIVSLPQQVRHQFGSMNVYSYLICLSENSVLLAVQCAQQYAFVLRFVDVLYLLYLSILLLTVTTKWEKSQK